MCILQHLEMKSMFIFEPIKRLVSMTVKSAKSAATCWIFLLRVGKTDTYVVWRWRYTLFCKKDESRLREGKTISISEELSPPITTKHIRTWTRKGRSYSIYGIIVSTPHWLTQLTKTSFTLPFYTLSVYFKVKWLSQSPTTILSGLSTLDQFQWLWMNKVLCKNWQ